MVMSHPWSIALLVENELRISNGLSYHVYHLRGLQYYHHQEQEHLELNQRRKNVWNRFDSLIRLRSVQCMLLVDHSLKIEIRQNTLIW